MQQIDAVGRWAMVVAVVLALGSGALAPRAQGPEPGMARTTQAELERWMRELSNWGPLGRRR